MPAPNPNAKRRNARIGPALLPSEGRTAPAPRWPLNAQSDEESAWWAELWALPQAVQWERMHVVRAVARYCRASILAEETPLAALLAQVLAMEDRLGLNPKALRMLMWEVAPDEVAERREDRGAATLRSSAVRDRIRAVDQVV